MIFGFQTYEKSEILKDWVKEQNTRFEVIDLAKNPFLNSKVIVLDDEYFIVNLNSIYPVWVEWLILHKPILMYMIKRQVKKKGYKGRLQRISNKKIVGLLLDYGKF